MATITVNMNRPAPFSKDGERIYEVSKSEASGKKYSVKTVPSRSSDERPKTINFGDSSRSDQNETKQQTLSYYSRAFNIKDGGGNFTVNDRMSANYWAVRVIWGNTHGIKEVKSGGNTFRIVRQ